jgi:6-phosphogluconolactonase
LPPDPELVVAEDPDRLLDRAADRVRAAVAAALAARGQFALALAGGNTPRALYGRLVRGVDWARAEIWFGDERAVPPDDPQSNYRMARESLLDPAGIPAGRVQRLRGEDPDLDGAARDYEAALRAAGGPPWLDLALLGMGPDGHTASLFPGTAALGEERRLAVAVEVPKLGRRLTLTLPAFAGTRALVFLVTGAAKAEALAAVLAPGSELPAARVIRRAPRATIFCDLEAGRLVAPATRQTGKAIP